MRLIAAVDNNWGIGNNNDLLVHIPEDQKFFRDTTMGHVVVLGRKTLEGFPNRLPLKGRTNIILSSDRDYVVENAIVVHSKEDLFRELGKYASDDVFIIGGESIYNMFYDYCDTAYITKVDKSYPADRYFPNLDKNSNWDIVNIGEKRIYSDIEYCFSEYKNKSPKVL